jgi:hypothetical protein
MRMFFVIANPMVVRFSLPESIACLSEKLIGFARRESFQALKDRAHGFVRHRPEDHVDMIGHDDPRMEVIPSNVEKPQSSSHGICYFGPFQPALTLACIQETLELAKIVALDFVKRILRRWFLKFFSVRRQRDKATESFRALCLQLKQHSLWQRICKSECDEIARAFTFYVREKTSRVNSRSKGVRRFWLNSGCAQFEIYAVKPGILFGRSHGERLRQREGEAQCSRFCGGVDGSMPSIWTRFAECNSAIQQIENLRYGGGTQFGQTFYNSFTHRAGKRGNMSSE